MEEDRQKKWEMVFAPRMRQIVPDLFLGNVKASFQGDMLRDNGINSMLSLTDGRWDLLTQLENICDFIDQVASPTLLSSYSLSTHPDNGSYGEMLNGSTDISNAIIIHCDLGISRSPTFIIAYLMRKYGMKRDEVTAFVQSKQKIKPNPNFAKWIFPIKALQRDI
ncbi:hypothetical protein FE257_002022 [Aspergillus nanangensis]|uniref:protein-tyrosine-phosphatase n=1 Tax=Aspergillus nanangensis TaxID=2582783 RepID=A0AAD4CT71_ASPNN|nr:hypothetical protein FE257_002022 [Aspergillus nanangensis]